MSADDLDDLEALWGALRDLQAKVAELETENQRLGWRVDDLEAKEAAR